VGGLDGQHHHGDHLHHSRCGRTDQRQAAQDAGPHRAADLRGPDHHGVIGAVLGTLGGYHARRRLVAATGGKDLPIALLEDAVAIVGGFAILAATGHVLTEYLLTAVK
jgi:hypothetical protein